MGERSSLSVNLFLLTNEHYKFLSQPKQSSFNSQAGLIGCDLNGPFVHFIFVLLYQTETGKVFFDSLLIIYNNIYNKSHRFLYLGLLKHV